MRIGILTLMHGFNYGGMLQCYALSRAIAGMGHEVKVLDYNPIPRWRLAQATLNILPASLGAPIEKAIERRKYGASLVKSFGGFRKLRLPLSKKLTKYAALCAEANRLDAVIVGSDQVWNTNWFAKEYFLGLGPNRRFAKLSYAACCGSRTQRPELVATVARLLADFDEISVRNSFTQEHVRRLCGRHVEVVADPTVLEDVQDIEEEVPLSESRYSLLYVMSEERLLLNAAMIADKKRHMGMKLIAIKSDVLQPWPIGLADAVVENPSVEQWLWLIRHASLVITDSFHGTLLAAKAGVSFCSILGTADSAIRLDDAVARYGLGLKQETGIIKGPLAATPDPLMTSHICLSGAMYCL